jgi:PhnB protein
MKLGTHITFNGQCQAAFTFYERCLGGKIVTMLTWGNSPSVDQVSKEWREKILHATMTVGDSVLMGADLPNAKVPNGFFVMLTVNSPDEAEQIFRALAENGKIQMPLQKTFWSPSFGVVVDQFGIPWEIQCEQATP